MQRTIFKHLEWSHLTPQNIKFHTRVKKWHLGNFPEFQLIGHALLVQSSKTDRRIFFSRLYIYIFFLKYETIVRSSSYYFGDSDPDPSSVLYVTVCNLRLKILLGFVIWNFQIWSRSQTMVWLITMWKAKSHLMLRLRKKLCIR